MNFNNITTLIVTVIVVIMISAAAIVPIVQQAQLDQKTTANNPDGVYNISTSSSSVTLELSETGVLIINGEADNQAYSANLEKVWAVNVGIRINLVSSTYVFQAIQIDSDGTLSSSINLTKLVYENGTLTGYVGDTVSLTQASDIFLYPDSKGNYAQYDMRQAATRAAVHTNNDAIIYVGNAGSSYNFLSGTIDDVEWVGYYPAGYDTAVFNNTIVESDDGLTWQFNSAPSYTLSDSTETSEPATSNWLNIYVPVEYDYISQDNSLTIALLGIIPLMVFVVPILLVVRAISNGRD